uniref:alpha/beta fold hydrolase n=1 Tax=Acetatifactor sp. TaxID=1872090 RepID=UPI0040571ACA
MKKAKKIMKVVIILLVAFIVVLAAIYINHRIQLHKEEALKTPLGKVVEIDGHQMSVYVEGNGDKTIVFMSGGGTCSPILDFRSLYSTLSDSYKIVVVEKFGYGFSDVVDKERSIDSILEDTRTALAKADIEGPYVLCPHSMSGIEALYWAGQYPEEVEAIIGLDMAVPKAYEDYKINMTILKISQFAARIGITRILPGVSESDAIRYGTLTDTEKEIYRAIFYEKTATTTMLNEVKWIKENAEIVQNNGVPQVPMLLFVSNGIGTGWNEDDWRGYQNSYLENIDDGKLINLDCPHYIHDYEYDAISEEIRVFLTEMPN